MEIMVNQVPLIMSNPNKQYNLVLMGPEKAHREEIQRILKLQS